MREFKSESADISRCFSAYGPPLSYCIGGRAIVAGYVCPHCGSSSPRTDCAAPAPPPKQS